MNFIVLLLGTTISAYLLTLFVEKACIRLDLLDHPNHRKTQKTPVPRLGGLTFVLIPFVAAYTFNFNFPSHLAVAALIVFVGGFLDDLSLLKSAFAKLFFQIPAVIYFVAQSDLNFLNLPSSINLAFKMILCFYLLFMVNAANLMDNINGLTSGLFLVWMLGLSYLARNNSETIQMTPVILIMMASVFGFLLRNFPWGKIYMGDQGSQLLGFFSGASSILVLTGILSGAGFKVSILTILFLCLFSILFIIDVALVVVIRLKEKRPIWHGDQCHISHQIIRKNLSATQTTILLTLIQLFIVGIAVSLIRYSV